MPSHSGRAPGQHPEAYQSLLEVWVQLMKSPDITDEKLKNLRAAYGRDVALLPVEQVSAIIATGGFQTPVPFLQTGLIHAWYATRELEAIASLSSQPL